MSYSEYWVKKGNKWAVAISIIFSFSLGDWISSLIYKATHIDSFIINMIIGVGSIYLVWFILGYIKKKNLFRK